MAKINKKIQVTVRSQKRPNLPKAAVNILTKWLEENYTNPYPTETTKKILMEVTNLTKNQIYNWFINSRRRILPNILKEKSTNKDFILMRIKRYTYFNQTRFIEHVIMHSNSKQSSNMSHFQMEKIDINENYNLHLLADVATKLPKILISDQH
ncbi:homeobox protein TGIF1-like [Daktulosphaira vitifoliae]|uniref:homeobox protein TGIF1-like n=1 Tax=Daktulosphaira vitifoliae TaxID=58002 RepID=UPI0021AA60A8|nr:homeobox protein TGIF1-like [Daktulosphaira vitifoliae]XP_050522168.1 homeobox protein TGIF1-like [Daktulosphaira vitifoliae]